MSSIAPNAQERLDRFLRMPVRRYSIRDLPAAITLRVSRRERERFVGAILAAARAETGHRISSVTYAIARTMADATATPGAAGDLIRRHESTAPGTIAGLAEAFALVCEGRI